MRPLNILGELARPATLALRLFGNILASTVMGRCSLAAARFGVMGSWTCSTFSSACSRP
jgi:F0F1-type ATP synthase membrane subunit a